MAEPVIITLVATDQDQKRHWGPEALVYEIAVTDPWVKTHDDIHKAIRAAAHEFGQTDAGKKWVNDHRTIDFMALPHIPEDITSKHGFVFKRSLTGVTWWPLAEDLAAED